MDANTDDAMFPAFACTEIRQEHGCLQCLLSQPLWWQALSQNLPFKTRRRHTKYASTLRLQPRPRRYRYSLLSSLLNLKMQASVRGKVPLVQSMAPKGSRGLATHTVGVGRGPTNLGAYRNFFTRAQNVIRHIPRLTQFFGPAPPTAGPMGSRLHHKLPETIHSRLSLSSKMALSRPLKAGGIPRPLTLPRPMHEVGLGTARKFSSQSAFQHIVQNNTSIKARAFWEADWDLKAAEERKVVAKARHRRTKASKSTNKSRASTRFSDDMSVYFAQLPAATVATFLQIALAPTPSNTMPLLSADEALLPLRAILDTHTTFQARAQDVAAIFAVLDSNNVWDDGVTVESWGDTRGLCVELRVKFEGWSEASVRNLLGHLVDIPGCSLQEVSLTPVPSIIDEAEDSLEYPNPLEFVMPASIAMTDSLEHFDTSVQSTQPTSPSAFSFLSSSDNGILSDLDVDLSDGFSDHSHMPASAIPNNLVFSLSSAFLSRIEDSNSVWSAE